MQPHFTSGTFVKLSAILGNSKANPPIPPVIPVSRSTWYAGIKSGIYPQQIKLGERAAAWLADDLNRLLSDLAKP